MCRLDTRNRPEGADVKGKLLEETSSAREQGLWAKQSCRGGQTLLTNCCLGRTATAGHSKCSSPARTFQALYSTALEVQDCCAHVHIAAFLPDAAIATKRVKPLKECSLLQGQDLRYGKAGLCEHLSDSHSSIGIFIDYDKRIARPAARNPLHRSSS